MSEATRTAALAHAVATFGPIGDAVSVLAAAETYHAFILKDASAAPKASTPARAPTAAAETKAAPAAAVQTPAAKLAAQKAAAAAKTAAATKSAEDAAAEVGEGGELDPTTLEAVEAIIADLLSANQRKKAVALLAEYSAKSASGVPEESRAEFIEKAQNILLGA